MRIKGGDGTGSQASCGEEPCSPQLQSCSRIPQPRSTMKVSAAALVALLLMATCTPSQAHLDGVPTSCCFSYQQRPVPRSLIASMYTTSSSCTQPGVILVTKKKRELCADPQAPWVQAHLKHFQSLEN